MSLKVALLRGVNVGGHRQIRMAELRELCERLGFTDVQTYVQSGNVVFRTPLRSDQAIAAKLVTGIEQQCGFICDIVVRSGQELESVVHRNPFSGRKDIEPAKLLVTFFASEPPAAARDKALALLREPEEMVFDGKELFLYFPNGIGKAKTPLASLERALKIPGTGRNWNTVLKLLEMTTASR